MDVEPIGARFQQFLVEQLHQFQFDVGGFVFPQVEGMFEPPFVPRHFRKPCLAADLDPCFDPADRLIMPVARVVRGILVIKGQRQYIRGTTVFDILSSSLGQNTEKR